MSSLLQALIADTQRLEHVGRQSADRPTGETQAATSRSTPSESAELLGQRLRADDIGFIGDFGHPEQHFEPAIERRQRFANARVGSDRQR